MNRRNFIKALTGIFLMPVVLFRNRKTNLFAFTTMENNENKYTLNSKLNDVIAIQNENATNWDYKAERYLDYINQEVVDKMVDEGVLKLTRMDDPKNAWKNIMAGYVIGDKISIKPNFNNINHGYRKCFTSPQVIKSLVRSLVDYLNVPEQDIYVYDLCKKIPKELIRDRIKYNVNYVERLDFTNLWDKVRVRLGLGLSCADKNEPIKMRNDILNKEGEKIICYIPKVLTQAEHLINVCFLTNHPFVTASGPLKNHFGTVRFSTFAQYPDCLHGDKIKEHIEDINLNEHIKNKTRLFVCDGLFGVFARGDKEGIHKWKTFPCKNGTPNTLLFSLDPIAMEQKIAEIIIKERKFHNLKR